MADRAAYEEHILYLIIELDQALARKPQWTPGQRDVARRSLVSLLERLPPIMPPS